MQELYADVIVDITSKALDRPFTYRIPPELIKQAEPGVVVEVPFGSRSIRGYIIHTDDKTALPPDKVKDIHAVITDGLGASDRLICLAAWMRSRYGCTMLQALRTVIPVKKKVKNKEKILLTLAMDQEEAKEKLMLYEKKHQTARARLLSALLEEQELPKDLVAEKLGITAGVIRALAQQGVLTSRSERVWRMPVVQPVRPEESILLTPEQQRAADGIWQDASEGKQQTFLLHGVTGSGKTAVYMELIERTLTQGKQAIVLIPEIALTWQTVMRFHRRFGDRVSYIHSKLSEGEKQDQFEMARSGEISVMIGPRSALFTPFENLGLIVIDEEHEDAYRSESVPRYNAVETAVRRGSIEHAFVVLGSATPSLESYYAARNGRIGLYMLSGRAGGGRLPEVEIVDMREQLRGGNRSPLSMPLRRQMEDALAKNKQVMLFINRRGIAGSCICRSCGEAIQCPHCDVSLTLHDSGRLICHYCGFEMPMVSRCPSCGSEYIRPMKAGTQQIEAEVHKLYPEARVLRMDLDTTRGKDDYAKLLADFLDQKADILIGTQMIVKGHDFPHVTVVGVLAADLSLHAASYRAAEKTFQLLTQAVGRAGRSGENGTAVIQTYEPEHYAVECASRQDYESFYEQEISMRRMGNYPPAGTLLAIHLSTQDPELAQQAARYLGQYAQHIAPSYRASVLGPVDETIARVADRYRKVLYVKADSLQALTALRDRLFQYIQINSGFNRVDITTDME